MSSRRWQRCWQRCPTTRSQRWTPRTTAYGHRRTVTSTREGVEHVTHGGLLAQKPPLPGKRPGVLLDPEPVQVVDAVTSYVAAPGPSSLVPRLAANDALDNATLKFLVARALLDRREQEKERGGGEGEEGEGGEGVLAAVYGSAQRQGLA